MKYSYTNGANLRYKPGALVLGAMATLFALASTMFLLFSAQAAPATYHQGFEIDTSDWTGAITRVASGTAGVDSSAGDWYANVDGYAFTFFDGARDEWPGDYSAEVDVYLDPAWSVGEGFDYTVASYGSDDSHQRDYIFHVGVAADGSLYVNASNNSDGAVNDYILNVEDAGYVVESAGWYTLQHEFYEDSGQLAVDLNLVDDSGTVLFTETRTNAADAIPTEIGGNGYGWFIFNTVADGLNADEVELFITVPDTTDPEVPTHIFPSDGAVLNSADLYIDWSESTDDVSDAEDITYKYRLYNENPDDNPSTTIRYQKDYVGSTRHPATGFAIGTPEEAYWWRVQACDEADNCSEFSEATKFTVDDTEPVVEITNPEIGETLSGDVEITGTVEDANVDKYRLLVRDLSTGDLVYDEVTSVDTSPVDVSYLWDTTTVEDGAYRVGLVGHDAAGNRTAVTADVTVDNRADEKNECKNGGWEMGLTLERDFHNQGDCVSHFASENQENNNPDGGRNENARRNR